MSTSDPAKPIYIQTVGFFERLHRRFLDVIKTELERLDARDITNVQALLLFHLGDREYTISEITQRGHYLGTNVNYNLGKLSENGYLTKAPSKRDRRAMRVRLSEKGLRLAQSLDAACAAHVRAMNGRIAFEDLSAMVHTMQSLEQFWNEFLIGPAPAGIAAEQDAVKMGAVKMGAVKMDEDG